MRDIFQRCPNAIGRLYMFFGLAVPVIITLLVIPVLLMAWVLTLMEHARGSPVPALIFFAALGSTMTVGLAIMFPLGYYLSCIVWGFRTPFEPADVEFGRRLFFKYCLQLTRVAIIAGAGCLLLALWPTTPSASGSGGFANAAPVGIAGRLPIPLCALSVKIATLRFYYLKGRELEKQMRLAYAADPPRAEHD